MFIHFRKIKKFENKLLFPAFLFFSIHETRNPVKTKLIFLKATINTVYYLN